MACSPPIALKTCRVFAATTYYAIQPVGWDAKLWFGWLRMVSTRCASSELQFGALREEAARERQGALMESLVRTPQHALWDE